MKTKDNKEKKNWIVRCKCVINKDIYVKNCTKSDAKNNPFDFAVDEIEVDQMDWTVKWIKEND